MYLTAETADTYIVGMANAAETKWAELFDLDRNGELTNAQHHAFLSAEQNATDTAASDGFDIGTARWFETFLATYNDTLQSAASDDDGADDTATLRTRRTFVSLDKADPAYIQSWVGLPAVHTTWDGRRLVGVIEWAHPDLYPAIRFPDGTWARQTTELELVVTS